MSAKQERKNLPNYYLALDLTPGVSHNDILHAYNRSKKTYSEGSLASYGLLEGNAGEEILREIEEAFVVLGNPSRRREYDMKMGFQTWNEDTGQLNGDISMVTTLKQAVESRPRETTPAPTMSSPVMAATATVVPMTKPVAAAVPSSSVKMKGAMENFEPNPEFEKQIAECKEVDGPFLKAVRIYRRMNEDQLAQRCKLSVTHIIAVENEELSPSHQPVYLRGHVYLMCQALEIPDAGELATSYVRRMRDLGKLPKTPF